MKSLGEKHWNLRRGEGLLMASAIRSVGSENKESVKVKNVEGTKKSGQQRASVIKMGIVKRRGLLRDSVLKEDWK
jgi:hypothetical protein